MSAPQAFLEAVTERADRLARHAPALSNTRRAGIAALRAGGIPTAKLETWKYTRIEPFFAAPFGIADAAATAPTTAAWFEFPGAVCLELRDGRPERIPAPAGVRIDALDEQRDSVNAQLDVGRYPLVNVNSALLEYGVRIVAAAGADAGTLDLRFASGAAASGIARIQVEVAAGARLTLIEQHAEQRPSNTVLELSLGPDAVVEHVRVLRPSDAIHWSLASVRLDASAHYRLAGFAMGGATRRDDIHVRLGGERARCDVDLACASRARHRLDEQIVVEHIATDTVSRQVVHGVATDAAELTFNGRIHIHSRAQRSDARLTNKNLLLDKRARVNTKPELEIYANDVKCSHGATVGQFDPAQLFYLRSRGIADAAARALLLRGFLADRLTSTARSGGVERMFAEMVAA
jgi:Fe-S cluster assembly protein SufD